MKLNNWCNLPKIQKMERMIPAFALPYMNIITSLYRKSEY